jgi:hydroxymethylpyrimidine/phosphomethylpyrimidine kinase
MLHEPGIVEVVAWAIDHYNIRQVVLDPVMVATSGDRLIAQETVQVLVRELFPRVTVVTPNLDEAQLLLGQPIASAQALDAAAQGLLAMGARAVLLKLGRDGVLVSDGAYRTRLAGHPVDAVDATGAGDCFAGNLLAQLSSGHTLWDATAYANAAAALSVQGIGAVSPLPRRDAVLGLLDQGKHA